MGARFATLLVHFQFRNRAYSASCFQPDSVSNNLCAPIGEYSYTTSYFITPVLRAHFATSATIPSAVHTVACVTTVSVSTLTRPRHATYCGNRARCACACLHCQLAMQASPRGHVRTCASLARHDSVRERHARRPSLLIPVRRRRPNYRSTPQSPCMPSLPCLCIACTRITPTNKARQVGIY